MIGFQKGKEWAMSEIKKCPKCGRELELGQVRDAPYWRKGIRLLDIGFGERIFAYRCASCGYIELYAQKKE
jgi:predicted nucleic-acid-binding Zn-ribbon protein